MTFRTVVASTLLATAAILAPAAPVAAQVAATASYDLPAQDLEASLRSVARTSGHQIIIASSAVQGRTAPALKGEYAAEQAVRALLAGTDVRVRVTPEAILVGGAGPVAAADQGPIDGDTITVTGSRIKGARLASPEITIDRQDIQRAGFGDLGEALRAVPQNFGGGQNPGLGLGATSGDINNQNVTGGSAVNLRGLGADATLTLLNGHRLSFGGYAQGIDISAIPTDAIERVEIIPDGSSALYGSDAVAGVVNVILRRAMDGVAINARLGAPTNGGGGFSEQYQAVAGTNWQSGKILAAYGYRRIAKIEAEDRDFTGYLGAPYPLIKGQDVHSAILSGSQLIADGVRFELDATFVARRLSSRLEAYGVLQELRTSDKSWSATPSLHLQVAPEWSVRIAGTYAESRTIGEGGNFIGGVQISSEYACYCHSLRAVEAYAEGPLFALPAGTVRSVVGGGYRSNRFATKGRTQQYGGSQNDAYLFGELQIPIVSKLNETPWAKSLTVTAAARFDQYNQAGSVGTPKVGVIYSPTNDLDLKFSWGRSFKAPSLVSQFTPGRASLLPMAYFTGGSTAPGVAGLYLTGGSNDLKPERARSVTWTIAFHPTAVTGLSADLSYFNVNYKDRVRSPIGIYFDALSPNYAEYVVNNPSAEQIQAAIAQANGGFSNLTGAPFDPSLVIYLIDNRNLNIASQKIEGVDANIAYRHSTADGALIGSLNGSWLRSQQKNGTRFAYFDLAGTAWNPPHYRFRGSIGWEGGGFQSTLFANYLGGVEDRRPTPTRSGKAMVTIDLSASYSFPPTAGLGGLRLGLVIENLFNRRPPYLEPRPFTEPYDSTNYSPIGRFLAVSLAKQF